MHRQEPTQSPVGTRRPAQRCPKCGRPVPGDAPAGHCPYCLLEMAGEDDVPTDIWPEPAVAGMERRFGDYALGRLIGSGGMGVVYEAVQVSLQRPVALKLIRDVHVASPTDLCRFTLEAEAAARLEHPNIVRIHEVGECGEHPFICMDLIDGESLQAKIARGELVLRRPAARRSRHPPSDPDQQTIARLMAKTARAVHHAHERGVLHRDLKPGNILIDRAGEPHLTDFGLAKILQQPHEGSGRLSLTAPGDFLGTPSYMSPEQVSGAKTTRASDVYGLGAVLYELLTGRPPFEGTTTLETLRQIADHAPARPRSRNPAIIPELETICLKCLDKDPRRRFSSAAALAEDLENWAEGRPIRARRTGLADRVVQWIRRNPIGTALIASLCLGLFVALTLLKIVYDQRDRIVLDRDRAAAEGMATISLIWDDPDQTEVIISAAQLAILVDRSPGDLAEAEYELYLGMSTEADPSSMAQRYASWVLQLQDQMSAVLGRAVSFRMKLFKRFNQDEDSLARGDADLMVLSAVDFLKAQARAPGVVPLARAKEAQEIVVFARADSGARQLAELAGKSIVFPDPDLSMTVWAKARLLAAGLNAANFWAWTNLIDQAVAAGETVDSYRDAILFRVLIPGAQGKSDAGVTYRRLFERYKHHQLVLLDCFLETPDVLAAREGLDPQILEAARRVIHSLKPPAHPEDRARDIPVDMVPASDSDFADLRRAMQDAERFEHSTRP